MKLSGLSKSELCELLKRILTSKHPALYVFGHFLSERYEKAFNKLMKEFEDIDITQDFERFEAVSKELDKLHNRADYYLQIDDLQKVNDET